jgi:GT2 family glycosyltransferase
MFKVSIIIPHFNGKNILQRCLMSLNNQINDDFEVIIIDNNSEDNSIEEVRKIFPKIRIIKQLQNFGFAKAINIGISNAKGEYVFLLNNDTEVDKFCMKSLIDVLDKNPEITAVTGKIKSLDNRKIIESVGDYINITLQPYPRGKGDLENKWNQGDYVFLITGGGSLFRKEIFNNVGMFDESFFAYYEDVDWCLRAQAMGYKFWFEPKAIIYHKGKTTSNRNPKFLEFLLFKNWMQLIIKNLPLALLFKRKRYFKIPLVYFHTLIYFAKKNLLKEMLLANLSIIIRLPDLFQSRAKILHSRKVDLDYLDKQMIDKKIKFSLFTI